MSIPATGAITMAQIQTEFGGTNQISLNEYYTGSKNSIPTGYGIPASGAISLGDFRGTQAFKLTYLTAIDANALGTTAGGSTSVNISASAGNFDRYIVLAVALADSTNNLGTWGTSYTINTNAVTTIFNEGFLTDGDSCRVAMVYRKITNAATTVTIEWTAPYYQTFNKSGGVTGTFYYEPDRGHAIFVYELNGIPTMGTINSVTGADNTTANMVLAGSTKRCAILITSTNTGTPTTMTNATITTTLNTRHTSWYDTNMGAGNVTYTTDAVNYGCFGGASFPY